MSVHDTHTPVETVGRGDYDYKKPELLLPAGDLETLKVAFHFGADAVYLGGSRYGLRAKAGNFSSEDMLSAVAFAHEREKKVYVTVNIYAHNGDLDGLSEYFAELSDIGPDAVLVSDPGVFVMAKRYAPDIPIHVSTQANTTNYEAASFWYDQGATRVVTARELSLSEIRGLREHIPSDMEIESFVHGSMCISYSGRCLLSSYMTGRDANRGACTHPCRWKYKLYGRQENGAAPDGDDNMANGPNSDTKDIQSDVDLAVCEDSRPGEYFPVEEDERGTYIFSSKDISMIGHIDELIDAGVDSFKIEGRMKNALYVATVARAYRAAIDECVADREAYRSHRDLYEKEIMATTYRPFGTGFYYGNPSAEGQIYDTTTYITGYTYLGIIRDVDESGRGFFIQKNKFSVGEEIELISPGLETRKLKVIGLYDEDDNPQDSCPHAGQKLYLDVDGRLSSGDIIRRKENK